MNDFGLWMSREIEKHGWSRSEVARRGGISPSTIDKVINEFARPGPKLCQALAKAFDMPDEDVFRLAGLLPRRVPASAERRPVYRINSSTPAGRLLAAFEQLRSEDQELLVTVAERLAEVVEPRIIGDAEEA
jgi:transcriptional regulator with XRE-family HTH domain